MVSSDSSGKHWWIDGLDALSDYQTEAYRTAPQAEFRNLLTVAAFGISGESGEIMDMIKKHLYHLHPLTREKLTEEMGDLIWYVAFLCTITGIELQDVLNANVTKLRNRYPNGFTPMDSINRDTQDKGR